MYSNKEQINHRIIISEIDGKAGDTGPTGGRVRKQSTVAGCRKKDVGENRERQEFLFIFRQFIIGQAYMRQNGDNRRFFSFSYILTSVHTHIHTYTQIHARTHTDTHKVRLLRPSNGHERLCEWLSFKFPNKSITTKRSTWHQDSSTFSITMIKKTFKKLLRWMAGVRRDKRRIDLHVKVIVSHRIRTDTGTDERAETQVC